MSEKTINNSSVINVVLYVTATILILTSMIYLFRPSFLKQTIKVPIEIPIEKEVIKYIEKDGIPTHEFVTHFNPRVDPIIANEIGISVDKYSKKYQLPRKLILSIIKKESSFNPFAKSSVAFGLMQIFPKYHKDKIEALGINDNRKLYHIDNNINIGCQIFREYFDQTDGDLDETFHKYLSKKATEKQKDAYKNDILTSWARMEFMEYQRRNKKPETDNSLQEIKEENQEEGNNSDE